MYQMKQEVLIKIGDSVIRPLSNDFILNYRRFKLAIKINPGFILIKASRSFLLHCGMSNFITESFPNISLRIYVKPNIQSFVRH